MDEINEKAIKDIIAYYDSLEETDDTIEETPSETPEEAPNLVELIEEAQKKENNPKIEEKETPTEEAEEAEEEIDEFSAEIEEVSEAEPAEEENHIPTITPVYDLSKLEEDDDKAEVSENKQGKKQIRTVVIAAVLLAALVTLFVTVDTGFIGAYKRNFSKNTSAIISWMGLDANSRKKTSKNATNYRNTAKSAVTIPMETAGKSVFADYNRGMVCAYTNYLSYISGDGAVVWENTTTIVDPILKTAGNYILIAEKGGKKICLYNDSKLFFETDTEDNILTCSVSANGDTVVVTDKSSYKGAVAVFNREGNRIFAWASGSDNIISADISSESRRVAVALLNTDNRVKSAIQLFDMNETQSYAQAVFEDTILFDIDFVGDTVSAFGDNCIAGLSADGELIYDKRFDNAEFVHYGMDRAGNQILLFDDTNIPLINIYNQRAVLKYQLTSDELPDFVNIRDKYIVFNSGRNVVYGKAGRKQLEKYTASMDIKNLIMIDKNTFAIVYSNNIEIVRM